MQRLPGYLLIASGLATLLAGGFTLLYLAATWSAPGRFAAAGRAFFGTLDLRLPAGVSDATLSIALLLLAAALAGLSLPMLHQGRAIATGTPVAVPSSRPGPWFTLSALRVVNVLALAGFTAGLFVPVASGSLRPAVLPPGVAGIAALTLTLRALSRRIRELQRAR